MAGLTNKDSSFFEIRSPDSSVDERLTTADFISLSVNEKMNQLTQGTLTLRDPNLVYARILRLGVRLRIVWGYRNRDESPRTELAPIQNDDEFTGSIERRGLEVMVEAPSGQGDGEGRRTYNCNFTALGLRGEDQVREFRSGTKASVVHEVLDELGVPRANRDVRFARGSEPVTDAQPVRQTESNFAFLTRLASREWRVMFAMNYDQKGAIHAIFVDPELLGKTSYAQEVLGARGRSNLLDYMGVVSNVINYSWKNNAGRSGTGDSVQIQIVDGQPTFQRYNVETQQVVTWRLQPELIDAELDRKRDEAGIAGVAGLTADILGAQSFEEVKRFFVPVEQSTAPQGYGYEVKARMFGNPMTMAGNLIEFGAGFPDVLGNDQTGWYAVGVGHRIDGTGYFMDVDVADAFTFSPTGRLI